MMKYKVETYENKEYIKDIPEGEFFLLQDDKNIIGCIISNDEFTKNSRAKYGYDNYVLVVIMETGELHNILESTLVSRCKKITIEIEKENKDEQLPE